MRIAIDLLNIMALDLSFFIFTVVPYHFDQPLTLLILCYDSHVVCDEILWEY